MTLLITGMFVFVGMHLVPTVPDLRARLVSWLGEQKYRGVYALISFAGVVLIVIGMGRAEYIDLWEPPDWGRHVAGLLMLPAIFALVASSMASNLTRWTAHPMLWGISCWAGAHLLANGDLASLILFGGFLAYSLYDMASANRRGATPQGELLPLSADARVLAISVAIYAGLIFLHPYIAGVSILT